MPELETDKPIQTKEFRIWRAVAISETIVLILLILSAFKVDFNINWIFLIIAYGIGIFTYYQWFRVKFPESVDDVILFLKRKGINLDKDTLEIQELFSGSNVWGIYIPEETTTYVVDMEKKYFTSKRKKRIDDVKRDMLETDVEKRMIEREIKLKQKAKEMGLSLEELKE